MNIQSTIDKYLAQDESLIEQDNLKLLNIVNGLPVNLSDNQKQLLELKGKMFTIPTEQKYSQLNSLYVFYILLGSNYKDLLLWLNSKLLIEKTNRLSQTQNQDIIDKINEYYNQVLLTQECLDFEDEILNTIQ